MSDVREFATEYSERLRVFGPEVAPAPVLPEPSDAPHPRAAMSPFGRWLFESFVRAARISFPSPR